MSAHEKVLADLRRLAGARDRARAAAHKAQAALIAAVRAAGELDEMVDGEPLRPSHAEMAAATGLTKKRIYQMVRGQAGRRDGTEHWRGVHGG